MSSFSSPLHRVSPPAPAVQRSRSQATLVQWLSNLWRSLRGSNPHRSSRTAKREMPCYYVD